MTDFRPSDYGVAPPRERSIVNRVLLDVVLAVLIGFGCAYQFRPQWVAQVFDRADSLRTGTPVQPTHPDDAALAALYQPYAMSQLGNSISGVPRVNSLLADLQKEPCDKRAIFQASQANATRVVISSRSPGSVDGL